MIRHLTIERAQGRWREILPRFGIDTRYLRNRHGPCPLCGGTDRFRFDDKGGSGSYFCNQCGSSKGDGAGIRLLMKFRNWDFKTAVTEVDRVIGTDYQPPPHAPPAKAEPAPWAGLYRKWQDAMP